MSGSSAPKRKPEGRKPEGLSAEQAELEALLASRTFVRAPLLSRMLAYICEQSLQGNSDALKEYSIGTLALGRGDDFDPDKDSVVRVMATRLRKRLAEYYAREGAGHHVKIFLSEVGYTPVFVAEPSAERLAASGLGVGHVRFVPYLVVGVLCGILGGILVWSMMRTGRAGGASAPGPNVRALWSEVLKPDQDTDMVLADSTFVLVQGLTGKSYSLTDYISRQYMLLPERGAVDPAYRDALNQTITRRDTSMADVHFAIKVFALAQSTRARVSAVFARDYTVMRIEANNVILVGSASSNPWVATFNNFLNFRIERGGRVLNLAPKPGEQSVYTDQVQQGVSRDYSMAAFLPKNGGARSVLIAAGTDTQCTQAAADYLTNEDQVKALRAKLAPKGSGRFPHFEVLLRTNKWSGGLEVVAYRPVP